MRYPLYTAFEIGVLREHYPRGGVEACRPFMSDRTSESIRRQARIHKITYHKPQLTLPREEIIEAWVKGMAINAIAKTVGIARSRVEKVVSEYKNASIDDNRIGLPPRGWSP